MEWAESMGMNLTKGLWVTAGQDLGVDRVPELTPDLLHGGWIWGP